MKNEDKIRDHADSIDMAIMGIKIEQKYGINVFENDIPETYGELRKRLLITSDSPIFGNLWKAYESKESIACRTSGTTGTPKLVAHPFQFWQRHIRPGSSSDIWGLCYDPSHIAGIFVILQAFANDSKMVLLWQHENPGEEIRENHVTHLSASSTFYRMLSGTFPEVVSVTIGSMRPIEDLRTKFPNAKIRNIYASTEHGVIGVSSNEWFPLTGNMAVSESGELLVNGQATGDIVVVNDNKYFIRGRQGQFAKVGGQKVYFEYVENVILENNPLIISIRVYAVDNAITGQILKADITTDYPLEEVITLGLNKHEIPYEFSTVDHLNMTDNGKIKR